MSPGEALDGERARCRCRPAVQFSFVEIGVLLTAPRTYLTGQGRFGPVIVCLGDSEVCAQCRKHEAKQIRLVEHLGRRAPQIPQFPDEAVVSQTVQRWTALRELRRAESRNNEVQRLALTTPAQFAAELESNEGAHTVPEKCKRIMREAADVLGQSADQINQRDERCLGYAVLAPRRLQSVYFNIGRHGIGPCPEC